MERMVELVVRKFAESERDKHRYYKGFKEASCSEIEEYSHIAWREAIEVHWTLYQILEEYGFTKDQLFQMEQEALEEC